MTPGFPGCDFWVHEPWRGQGKEGGPGMGGSVNVGKPNTKFKKKDAPAGNQTRVWSVAGTYSITELPAHNILTQDRTGDLLRVRQAS